MHILRCTHEALFEPHVCPQCGCYWVFCRSCGYVQSFVALKSIGHPGSAYFKCEICSEPFWVDGSTIQEVCPPCERWNQYGDYQEWEEEKDSPKTVEWETIEGYHYRADSQGNVQRCWKGTWSPASPPIQSAYNKSRDVVLEQVQELVVTILECPHDSWGFNAAKWRDSVCDLARKVKP